MISLFLLFILVSSQYDTVHSDCSLTEFCTCDTNPNIIICDGNYGNQSDNNYFPPLSLLPSVKTYIFRNFKEIQAHAFENMTFLTNHSITICLFNITTIDSDAFSTTMIIPTDSTISIDIEHAINSSSITLRSNAFNHIKLQRLRFFNIKHFNGHPIFDTKCFSEHLHINELIFEQSGITGFANSLQKSVDIKHLYIRECPSLTELTNQNIPSFLHTTETLEISATGLQLINFHTFQGWTLILKELIIRNNPNLKIFSSNIIEGFLMELNKLDLSNNSIDTLQQDYNWLPYIYTKHLILRQQQQLDLFLKADILKILRHLRTIDFSEGFISENDEGLIRDHMPNMPNLISINISHTNLTANMIIDLLTQLGNSANQTIRISLLGHTLDDENFCSYFTIFQKSPNLLHLELDPTHECNCVVDLFYQDEHIQTITNDSLQIPACLSNITRTRCDIQSQITMSKCSIAKPNPNEPETNVGDYAFIGIMVGLAVVVLVLVALGSSVAYRVRKNRRGTILDMEEPIENPLATIIEERLQNSH